MAADVTPADATPDDTTSHGAISGDDMPAGATGGVERPHYAAAHQRLRTATAADHALTDAAFGRFDLADRASYTSFLRAHARALPAIEDALWPVAALPPLAARSPALLDDLALLGAAPDRPLAFEPPVGPAAAWGARYVIEGSRLGGAMLARAIAPGLPRTFLDARHAPGEWRGFCAALDTACTGERWLAEALAAARATFRHYAAAAEQA